MELPKAATPTRDLPADRPPWHRVQSAAGPSSLEGRAIAGLAAGPVGTWHDPDLGRPIAAPLERCAELLGVDLATVREAAANIEPYVRADGTRVWSLMQLERQLRPEVYWRRRGGYLDRRRTPAIDG
jgi:hypothetical protein